MRFSASIFSQLIQPIDRRCFAQIVAAHDADRYDKTFRTWAHFAALAFVQLSGSQSLREVETRWNAQAHHHYHLGARKLARSTLSDANARRPAAVFADLFAMLAEKAHGKLKREGREIVRLIDSTPIPLPQMCDWVRHNRRIHGLKMHVVHDPHADCPTRVEISHANVNDIDVGRTAKLEKGAVYVFDKAYYDFDWWGKIHAAGATFVTRPKTMTPIEKRCLRRLGKTRGDGFTVIEDAEVRLTSRRGRKLDMPLRVVRVARDRGGAFDILTNDMSRSAYDIALLYKTRWQIELLFRWLKQHLRLRRFLGRCENAVRAQALVAMIVFLLLRMAAALHRLAMAPLRFAELARDHLFARQPIGRIGRPPDPRPNRTGQLELCYA